MKAAATEVQSVALGNAQVPLTRHQKHGFSWEKELLTNVYKALPQELKSISYTSAKDLPAAFNHLDNIALSIKTTGSAAVCMGDALRVYDSVTPAADPLNMCVVTYKQVGTTKQVKKITEVSLADAKEALFGEVTREEIAELDRLIKAVPKGRSPTKEEKLSYQSYQSALQAKTGAIIFNPKLDSKSQRRLQCSFNKFEKFLEKNPERLIASSTTNAFRGGEISASILSDRRVLKSAVDDATAAAAAAFGAMTIMDAAATTAAAVPDVA
jgi:hypothetical protein